MVIFRVWFMSQKVDSAQPTIPFQNIPSFDIKQHGEIEKQSRPHTFTTQGIA